jgi:hypothetical protein
MFYASSRVRIIASDKWASLNAVAYQAVKEVHEVAVKEDSSPLR